MQGEEEDTHSCDSGDFKRASAELERFKEIAEAKQAKLKVRADVCCFWERWRA